jgi:hypothetical protein
MTGYSREEVLGHNWCAVRSHIKRESYQISFGGFCANSHPPFGAFSICWDAVLFPELLTGSLATAAQLCEVGALKEQVVLSIHTYG